MSIAITGASGQLGRRTAELVLDQVDPSSVVLVTRNPEKLAEFAARGVQVRAGDFEQPDGLAAAFAGVEKLLIISTTIVEGRGVVQSRAARAAIDAGVKQIGYTSLADPVGNPALVSETHVETEEFLKASGIEWTLLRNNLYADDQIPGIEHAGASGQFVTNAGNGAVAYVTREDCAAAAAAFLTTDGHAGRTYEITGPESVTASDLAALAGDSVEVVQVDDSAYANGLVAGAGLPEVLATLIASFGKAAREGFQGEVSGAVEELTGNPATPLAALIAQAV